MHPVDPIDQAVEALCDEYDRRFPSHASPFSVHPRRFGELVSLETLTTSIGGPKRLAAVRAVVRLAPAVPDDGYRSCMVRVNFAGGGISSDYYNAEGRFKEGFTDHIAHYDQLVRLGDPRAPSFAVLHAVIAAAALSLMRSGHVEIVERLRLFLHERCDEFGPIFRREAWPAFAALLRAAPVQRSLADAVQGLVPGRWIAVANRPPRGTADEWHVRLFRFSGAELERDWLSAVPAGYGLRLTPSRSTVVYGWPSLIEECRGEPVSFLDPTKIFEVPEAVVEKMRAYVPPCLPPRDRL